MRAKWVAVAVAGAGAAYVAEKARRARGGPATTAPEAGVTATAGAVGVVGVAGVAPSVAAVAPSPPEPLTPAPPTPEPALEPDEPPTVEVPVLRAVPESRAPPEPDLEDEVEQVEDEIEIDDEEDDAPSTRVALSGFYVGLVCMLFAPVLYFSATDWLFAAETSAELTPFVLLLLAVPAILVAVPRTRRFGLYMVLGLALTGVIVAVTAIAVLVLLLRVG
ncbi:MAG TPA: hypothetical protein VGE77_11605 [Nocardioides sp.]